jgi:hypothetical protein
MTRVYLDTSIYNRPFDDQTQPKIFLETQAVILILQLVEAKLIELVIPFLDETATYFTPRLTPSPLTKGGLQGGS